MTHNREKKNHQGLTEILIFPAFSFCVMLTQLLVKTSSVLLLSAQWA